MNALRQPLLPLHISSRAALVGVEVACAALGVDADTIFAMIDDGQLPWAWDICAARKSIGRAEGERREWRIWRECITSRQSQSPLPDLKLADVINQICPPGPPELPNTRFQSGRVVLMLGCSRHNVSTLARAGLLERQFVHPHFYFTRASIVRFLTSRVIQ
jgi:hypothetical protein